MVNRRIFMQLLGSLGALAPSIPGVGLFSEESYLVGGGDHYVFKAEKPPRVFAGAKTYHDMGDGAFISLQVPKWKRVVTSSIPYGDSQIFQGEAVSDPDEMVGFFLGANSLQERMKFPTRYEGKSLFTVVYMPIMAMPLSDKGYFLQCEIAQFFADKGDVDNLSDATSNIGQIPVEAPSDIDLKFMNMLESEFRRLGGGRRIDVSALARSLRART